MSVAFVEAAARAHKEEKRVDGGDRTDGTNESDRRRAERHRDELLLRTVSRTRFRDMIGEPSAEIDAPKRGDVMPKHAVKTGGGLAQVKLLLQKLRHDIEIRVVDENNRRKADG